MLETLWHDLRHALRMLLANPGFSLIAVVSIAIGVGANVGMFSVADTLVLRPLPVPSPSEVVRIAATMPGPGIRNTRISYPDYIVLRDDATSFEGLVAYRFVTASLVERPNEAAERRFGMAVSGNLFEVMRVQPLYGRAFRPDEDEVVGRNLVVILDYDEWTRRFGGDARVVGRTILIGGHHFTVVGIAPPGFTGVDAEVHPTFYIPLSALPSILTDVPPDERTRRDVRTLVVKGRLKDDIPLTQARAETDRIAGLLQADYPETNRNLRFAVWTEIEDRVAGGGATDGQIAVMLLTLAAFVLVVACANLGGLLTSRAPARTREIALRMAMGAQRGRLLRQLVTESLLLAGGGGALGIGLGYMAIAAFQRLEIPTDVPLKLTFTLDQRAFAVGVTAALVSALASSLLPAWRATRIDLTQSIRLASASRSSATRLWGRNTLVCGQVALTLVVLTVAVLLFRTFQAELRRGPGYRTDHILIAAFDTTLAQYDEARSIEFYRLLKERAQTIAGVRSVALTSTVPMKTDTFERERIRPDGFDLPPDVENVSLFAARIDEDYFGTMGIALVRGRGIQSTDTANAPSVVVVNQSFASRYWAGQEPLGKRVRLDDHGGVFAEVVGIVADTKHAWIGEGPEALVYLSRQQAVSSESTLLLRSEDDPAMLAAPLREIVRDIDPSMPAFGVRTMEDLYYSRAVHTTRLLVGSVAGMGSMGMVLAMVGLYGVVAYSTRRRTREIGVRIAVGANPNSVLAMVVRQGMHLLIGGVALGLVASAALGRLLLAAFPTAAGLDLVSYSVVISALAMVTLLAVYGPARRASRVNPVVALKAE